MHIIYAILYNYTNNARKKKIKTNLRNFSFANHCNNYKFLNNLTRLSCATFV